MPPQSENQATPIPEQTPVTPDNNPAQQVVEKKEPGKEGLAPSVSQPPAQTPSAAPIQNIPVQQPVQPSQPVQPTSPPQTEDMEASDVGEIDKKWVQAVETVMETDKANPYEQEEKAHKLSISYLLKRFGKKIKGED